MANLTDKLNGIISGTENAVSSEKNKVVTGMKDTVARVKKNIAEDQAGLKNGTVGRYQYTNPLRK